MVGISKHHPEPGAAVDNSRKLGLVTLVGRVLNMKSTVIWSPARVAGRDDVGGGLLCSDLILSAMSMH